MTLECLHCITIPGNKDIYTLRVLVVVKNIHVIDIRPKKFNFLESHASTLLN